MTKIKLAKWIYEGHEEDLNERFTKIEDNLWQSKIDKELFITLV